MASAPSAVPLADIGDIPSPLPGVLPDIPADRAHAAIERLVARGLLTYTTTPDGAPAVALRA